MDIIGPHTLGLLATAILLATLTGQTIKQWREGSTTGIARWFFLGQVSASVCFVAYSLLIHSILFAVTNALILLSALAGYVVLRRNRRRAIVRARLDERMPLHGATIVPPANAASEGDSSPHLRVVVLG